jgi:iron complex transport system permease protein
VAQRTAGAETAGIAAEARPRTRRRTFVLFAVLALVLIVASLVSAMVGQVPIPPTEVIGSILQHAGIANAWAPHDPITDATLWVVRFPRMLMAVVVGAALAVAGSVMQAIFGNPLAEPGIVGVSSGAALGAASSIVLGLTALGGWSAAVLAFAGGFGAVILVYIVSRSQGRTEVVTLILTGIAINAFAGAVIGLLTFFSDDAELRSIVFWTLGSMAQATWQKVAIILPFAAIGLAFAFGCAGRLDLLALGERPARHLGIDVERLRITMLTIIAVLTAAAVAVSGQILFVGLVIPHLVRMVAGPGHKLLLPASALLGATVLVLADLVARTVAAPAEVPLGVLTALIGSPFFFWQLRRTRARQGGWA